MKNKTYYPAQRSNVDSFLVMDLLYSANQLEANGKNIFHLELGEPQPKTPKKVVNEAARLSKLSLPGYTPSNGIISLRKKVADYYFSNYKIRIDKDQVFITSGSSGAFLLTFLSCFDPGSRVAIFNPVYPAYRNILKCLNIDVVEIYPNKDKFDKIDISLISDKKIDGLIVSNPNNPNGQVFNEEELKYIYDFFKKKKIILISDEIYHGIEFIKNSSSMLNFGQNVIVINSFSKFFCMPGWRLGWVVIPKSLGKNFLKLSQNLFISSGNIAQYSALKVFDCMKELKTIVKNYKLTRDKVNEVLERIPIINFSKPNGAFYFYLDISKTKLDSFQFVKKLMNDTGVVLTPGLDFDKRYGKKNC
ncbi:MAG: aminotransferase class I/II-fold pyridoxal phosphate-dependent enzyme [Pseudomonadota bacterium]|nr:aminotransferase class I/II-fold pyridoxal phosphate-dependent enzyme [Pseudomonadota bacterium]